MHEVTPRHFIISTAGHVDHGKSTLVKALTGTDPDRLPEEKRRQITIDLGFAELDLTSPDGDGIHAGIVDVPGHEDFVRNMIAGVGSIDLALFVVAADDGWMPQTEEHLQILTYLGVNRAVIALTKSDLARSGSVRDELRAQLAGTAFAHSPIVSTSVRTGAGIEDLKNAIATELTKLEQQRDIGKPRLFIDRVFTLRGIGTVVTGTLTGGQLHRGQSIVVQPGGLQTRIRSIQSHGCELEVAEPGMRTAINLPDISLEQIKRGDVVTVTEFAASASSACIALLEKSSRLDRDNVSARSLKHGASVYVYHGTTRVLAKVAFVDAESLATGEQKIARLKLQSPLLIFLGDRFVLRDPSERYTIGGGIVLDRHDADPRELGEGAKNIWMWGAGAPGDVDVCVRSELERRDFVQTRTLLSESNFSTAEIAASVNRLTEKGEIVIRDGIVVTTEKWQDLTRRAAVLVDGIHRKHPERHGLELSELRDALPNESAVLEALVEELSKGDFLRTGTAIARRSHLPSLPPQIRQVAGKIRGALGANMFNPPSRKELVQDRVSEAALRFLIADGEVVELDGDILLLREGVAQMRETVVAFISKHGVATASELRHELGTSRRVVIPFLEYLDRAGVTRRVGDRRVLANKSTAAKLSDAASTQRT
jgi:selenocysteine-specific elongation factor